MSIVAIPNEKSRFKVQKTRFFIARKIFIIHKDKIKIISKRYFLKLL